MVVGTPNYHTDNVNDLGAAFVYKLTDGNWTPFQKLTSLPREDIDEPNTLQNSLFGYSVAIKNNYIVVGSIYDGSLSGIRSGAAYVFKLENDVWVKKQRLTSFTTQDSSVTDGDPRNDLFGYSIALSDNYLAISATQDDATNIAPEGGLNVNDINSGAVYVFDLSGDQWVPYNKYISRHFINESELTDNVLEYDGFGESIAIHNNLLAVGAPYEDPNDINSMGTVYIFDLNKTEDEIPINKLIAFNVQNIDLKDTGTREDDKFGISVRMNNTYLAVCASNDDPGNSRNTGAIYIYRKLGNEWKPYQKLKTPLLNNTNDVVNLGFRNSMEMTDKYIVIGASSLQLKNTAYVYELNQNVWTLKKELSSLQHNISQPINLFGRSIGLTNDYIFVGAPENNGVTEINIGGVFVFKIREKQIIQSKKLEADFSPYKKSFLKITGKKKFNDYGDYLLKLKLKN